MQLISFYSEFLFDFSIPFKNKLKVFVYSKISCWFCQELFYWIEFNFFKVVSSVLNIICERSFVSTKNVSVQPKTQSACPSPFSDCQQQPIEIFMFGKFAFPGPSAHPNVLYFIRTIFNSSFVQPDWGPSWNIHVVSSGKYYEATKYISNLY